VSGSLPLTASMFLLGVLHGLEPGHGKSLMASYLVGRRGRWPHAVYLGAVVAFSHSAVVIALAAPVSLLAEQFQLEGIISRIEFAAGLLIAAIGVLMLGRGLRRRDACCSRGGCDHHHDHRRENDGASSLDRNAADPSALADATWRRPSLWGLTALGITGGIVPCPTAIAALLGAISSGRPATGTVMILIFSLGMASVLIAIGLTAIRMGDRVRRWLDEYRWSSHVPTIIACLVVLLGLGLVGKALFGELTA
jgi:nickel/cobalt exporter